MSKRRLLKDPQRASKIYSSIFAITLFVVLSVVPFRLPRLDESTVTMKPEKGSASRKPLVSKIVLVMIDGWGDVVASKPDLMPNFERLSREGARGIAQANFPTMTTNGVTALATGRRSPPGMGFPGGIAPDPEYDSVFSRAKAAGLHAFIVGQEDWQHLFKGHGADMTIFPYRGEPLHYDEPVLSQGMEIMRGEHGPWNLLVMHLFDLDPTGHVFGRNSPQYRSKIAWLDAHLKSIVDAAGPQACVIFTADHGQLENGNHGGLETEVRNVPLLFIGNRVVRGPLGTVDQRDVAATIAGLLGTAQPALSRGWPIFQAFDLSDRERADIMLDVLDQRSRKRAAVRSQWSWMLSNAADRAQLARKTLTEGRPERAEMMAHSAALKIDESIDDLSPRRWFGRGVLGILLLTLSVVCSIAWPVEAPAFLWAALVLASLRLLGIVVPILLPAVTPVTSIVVLLSSIGLFTVSLFGGLERPGRLTLPAGIALAVGLVALACPSLVDTTLWAWLAVWTIFLTKAYEMLAAKDSTEYRSLALGLAAVAAAFVITSWTPALETSLLRSMLPTVNLRSLAMPSWLSIEIVLWLALAVAFREYLHELPKREALFVQTGALILAVVSFVAAQFQHNLSESIWLAELASVAFCFFLNLPARQQGVCLSLLGLVYCQTLSNPRSFCFLQLATLASWTLAALPRPRNVFRQGFELFALCLWANLATNGHLDFSMSSISVAEAYSVLGQEWQPHLMVFLLALKYALLVLTPALALLVELPSGRLFAATPFLGAWCTGHLAILWLQQFYMGRTVEILINDPSFEALAWSVFFMWSIGILWLLLRGFRRLSAMTARRRWFRSPIPMLSTWASAR